MKISAHETNNAFHNGDKSTTLAPWAHTWSAQKNVTPAIVQVTGGTYA